MKKRIISLCLAFAMAVCLLPMSVFAAEAAVQNAQTGATYANITTALAAAQPGQTLKLLQDVTDSMVVLNGGTTLDLNGHTLTAACVVAFAGGHVIDSAANKGLLKVDKSSLMLQSDNAQMPIWNEKDGYILAALNLKNEKIGEGEGLVFKSLFKPSFGYASTAAGAKSIAKQFFAENGMVDNGLTVVLRLSWDVEGSTASYDFEYSEELVKKVYGDPTNSTWFSLGVTSLASEAVNVQVVVVSDTGVETVSKGLSYTAH